MQHQDFLTKVEELVTKASRQGYRPVQMAIGNGIVIVQDSENEFDTYFDRDKWGFIQPQIWENENARIGSEIGILPGNGKYPPVSSFYEAMLFAFDHLRGLNRMYSFYPVPQSVN